MQTLTAIELRNYNLTNIIVQQNCEGSGEGLYNPAQYGGGPQPTKW